MEIKMENTNKEPCFKCVIRNLPEGKMGSLCSFCPDCEAKHKDQEKKERERILAEVRIAKDEWVEYKNYKCETCQMPFLQMIEQEISPRLWNNKLYCREHFIKCLASEARKNTSQTIKSNKELSDKELLTELSERIKAGKIKGNSIDYECCGGYTNLYTGKTQGTYAFWKPEFQVYLTDGEIRENKMDDKASEQDQSEHEKPTK